MSNADYKNHPNPNLRALAELPEGEPLFPGDTLPEGLLGESAHPDVGLALQQAMIAESVAQALRAVRASTELTGAQLADLLGVSKQRVGALENTPGDRVQLGSLAEYFHAAGATARLVITPASGPEIVVPL